MTGKYSVIVIGAGVGGLTAAAYLAKKGMKPLVIEQTSFPGGRCYSRIIDGVEYDIGALYIGGCAQKILKEVLGIDIACEPYRIGIRIGQHLFSMPFDIQTLRELLWNQTIRKDIFRLALKIPNLFKPSYFDCHQSIGETLDSLTSNDIIRKIGYVMFGALGVSPYRLPSHYLRMDKHALGTKVGNPVHFLGGNRAIADLLTNFILKLGGQIVFEQKVNRIIFENGRACGVVTKKAHYFADFIISNTDIQTTILNLCPPDVFQCDPYISKVKALKKPLSLVCVFLTFDSMTKFPRGFGAFFVPSPSPIEEFEILEYGQFPKQSTFCLYVPTNVGEGMERVHRGTLQFYYPRGSVTSEVLNRQVQQVLTIGLDYLFGGLSSKVLNYSVYDPQRYEQSFGFYPSVFGVSPDLNQERLPQRTPISNLFCVGDSVQPDRPSVPQAMESGLFCAHMLAKDFNLTM